MKYIIVIGDGMADYPLEELNGRTPLEEAHTPNMDFIANKGKNGRLKTIPEGIGAGSDIANLSILGYDPKKYYTGRGPIEAASIGVEMGPKDIAFRCNLITEKNGIIEDYCADHISSEEAKKLMEEMNHAFGDIGNFYPGVSYRNLFLLHDSNEEINTTPPHDVLGSRIIDNLVKPENNTAKKLNKMILDSKNLLSKHEVNIKRVKEGKKPGNMVWLWGQGRKPKMETFKERYGISGAIISAVDLIKGIGIYAGMEIVKVPGATGYYDTNYEGKAEYILKALDKHDFVYAHVEAPDEASHAGDIEMKIKTIEDLDKRLIGTLLRKLEGDYTIAVLPDHVTPIKSRTHTSEAVPFAIYSPSIRGDGVKTFNEKSVKDGSLGIFEGKDFLNFLLKGNYQ